VVYMPGWSSERRTLYAICWAAVYKSMALSVSWIVVSPTSLESDCRRKGSGGQRDALINARCTARLPSQPATIRLWVDDDPGVGVEGDRWLSHSSLVEKVQRRKGDDEEGLGR
jgi:hypothetical protein